jgi:FlaA1/EpsC-like NDP-sugar epimerase
VHNHRHCSNPLSSLGIAYRFCLFDFPECFAGSTWIANAGQIPGRLVNRQTPSKEFVLSDSDALTRWLSRGAEALLHTSRSVKRALAIAIDALSCIMAVWLSFMVRLGLWLGLESPVLAFAAFAIVCTFAVFFAVGMYNNVFRFHGSRSLGQIARSCAIIAIPTVVVFGYVGIPGVPRTVSVIFPLLLFVLIALNRIVARFFLFDMLEPRKQRRRVLIYGAGRAGRQLAVSLQHETSYHLVAYADDDPELIGQRIEGIPILSPADTDELLRAKEVDVVLLAMPTLRRSARGSIVERLRDFGVHVQTLPSIREIVSGEVSVSDLREVEVVDLLSRDPVVPDEQLMGSAIAGKTVLVTGAGGSIGSELCRQIIRLAPTRLVLFEMTEASLFAIDQSLRMVRATLNSDTEIVAELGTLVSPATVTRLFERWRPHTVFHAAAYKHVPLVEANAVAGVQNNVEGTLNCALAARSSKVERFILVSTDKAVRPTNVMGASKRVCELILQALAAEKRGGAIFAMVRFGNVLGSSGSVVPHFQRQIAQGGPVTLTHKEVTRYFMTIPEAAELVIQAGAMAEGGEVYLLDMGEPVRIADLARSMISLSGRTVRDSENPDGDIEIVEIGLRPGEKLYEELLIGAEATRTTHERIFRAHEEHLPWAVLRKEIASLQEATRAGDHEGIKAQLAELVQGYKISEPVSEEFFES